MKITFTILIALFSFVAKGEIAPAAPKEFEIISIFTKFHSSFNHDKSLEFRVFEADGSASVAYNPTYLYFVVTNNLSGFENQTKVVTLPSVSKVVSVNFNKQNNQINIKAKFDKLKNNGQIISNAITKTINVIIKENLEPKRNIIVEVSK